jgi:hypothetical protein
MLSLRARLFRTTSTLCRMVSTGFHTSAANNSSTRVLVVGGSYAGLGAALNLHDLFHGKPRSNRAEQLKAEATETKFPIEITIVDERDGFCKCQSPADIC